MKEKRERLRIPRKLIRAIEASFDWGMEARGSNGDYDAPPQEIVIRLDDDEWFASLVDSYLERVVFFSYHEAEEPPSVYEVCMQGFGVDLVRQSLVKYDEHRRLEKRRLRQRQKLEETKKDMPSGEKAEK